MILSSTSRHCNSLRELRVERRAAGFVALLLLTVIAGSSAEGDEPAFVGQPYVYTHWETFYAGEGGLPNDHVFALTADGNRLWVGTEDGLAGDPRGLRLVVLGL